MKRLTISMSDELFDKLNALENKSLFIRKLIERELEAMDNFQSEEVTPWSEGFSVLRSDVRTIFNRLEEMENKLAGMDPSQVNIPTIQDTDMQKPLEETAIIQNDLIPDADGHEYTIPADNTPAEIPDISNDTGNISEICDESDILNSNAGNDIGELQNIVAENNPDTNISTGEEIDATKAPLFEQTISIENPEITDADVQTQISEDTELTLMENFSNDNQITPSETTLAPETDENMFSHPVQEAELNTPELNENPLNPPHEHKLSELVAEKTNKQENEAIISNIEDVRTQIPSFIPPEQNMPNQEIEQTEFQMPELKPPAQEIEQTEFQMPELKPPAQEIEQTEFQMPELKLPVQEVEQTEFQMPELKPPVQEVEQTEFQMPELKSPVQEVEQTEFQMPELKPPVQEIGQTEFQMPELKSPEQEIEQTEFQMPEMKPPVQEIEQTEFQMPELKPPVQEIEQTEFQMPEMKAPDEEIQQTAFAMPELKPQEQDTGQIAEQAGFVMPDLDSPGIQTNEEEIMPPFDKGIELTPEMQNAVPEMQEPHRIINDTDQGAGVKPDKLETNILMYLPRGAKVKKEIIKSLVSRQFSQEDIEKKIQELVAREILILRQEDGTEQLHRLK